MQAKRLVIYNDDNQQGMGPVSSVLLFCAVDLLCGGLMVNLGSSS